jgi:hypothetical protein
MGSVQLTMIAKAIFAYPAWKNQEPILTWAENGAATQIQNAAMTGLAMI